MFNCLQSLTLLIYNFFFLLSLLFWWIERDAAFFVSMKALMLEDNCIAFMPAYVVSYFTVTLGYFSLCFCLPC